jgi:aspartate aminotransferase-like enzyme
MHIKKQRLLTPGPTPLYPKALQAMMGAEIHHRTQDFRDLYSSVLGDLKAVLGTAHDVLMLASSGTGAMEAAVTNCFSAGDRVIVCSAGKFGERWTELTRTFGLEVLVLNATYGSVVEPAALAQTLAANPDVQGVFVQASESSTGAAHDVHAMGEIVKRTAAVFIVDAITGIGSMPLDIDRWGLDIVIGGSQKAFMLPPGLAFLSISPKAWGRMESARLPRYYFDLQREKKSAAKGESSWTPAIALILGLAEVLKYVKTLGMDQLIDNAQQLAAATGAACGALGLELFAPLNPSGAVTAVKAPPGLSASVMVREFHEKFGSIIADGQGEMAGRIFRIAHLGYYDIADLFALVAELELILLAHGVPVELGAGVAAVQQCHARQNQPVTV